MAQSWFDKMDHNYQAGRASGRLAKSYSKRKEGMRHQRKVTPGAGFKSWPPKNKRNAKTGVRTKRPTATKARGRVGNKQLSLL